MRRHDQKERAVRKLRYILCPGDKLYVDMESGRCGQTWHPSAEESREKLTHGQLQILSYLVLSRE